jgi:pyruvate formate lyase activating enzyme
MTAAIQTSCEHPHCVPSVHVEGANGPIGYLHSVESGAASDGPGMRFVFFVAGCPFRCVYCHNPDTWKRSSGRQVTVDEAIEEIRPYIPFLKMAGGVTVSGGEPLMQPEFVGALLSRLHDEFGLHTALDTQGYLARNVSSSWFDAVDLVLLDIKHIDPVKYRQITSCELAPTLDFAQRLVRLGKPMWIRYVLVPGLTDDAGDIARHADFLASLGPLVQRVDVLPFHQMAMHKWEQLDREYTLKDTPTPTPEQVAAAIEIFRSRNLPAV